MTRRPPADPDRLRPLGPAPLTVAAGVGLVLGWLWHRVASALDRPVALIGWSQALVLFFVAVVLGAVAWSTRRAVRDRRPELEAQRMVNRLVLARACALVGALFAGAYLGYAISWIGTDSELRTERIVRALVAGAGAGLMTSSAVGLERACRVRSDEDAP